jgi:hypothetical protein
MRKKIYHTEMKTDTGKGCAMVIGLLYPMKDEPGRHEE